LELSQRYLLKNLRKKLGKENKMVLIILFARSAVFVFPARIVKVMGAEAKRN